MSVANLVCNNCNLTFTRVYSYKRHIANGRCVNSNSNLNEDLKGNLACMKCGKSFANKYTLKRHEVTICNHKKQHSSLLGLDGDASVLLGTIISSVINSTKAATNPVYNNDNNQINTYNTINKISNTNNGIINNDNRVLNQQIHINPIGKESLDHLTKENKIHILMQGMNAVPALVKAILEVPENRNIAITDKKNKKVTFVNKDGKVEIGNLTKVLSMYTTDNIDRIDLFLEEYKNELPLHDKTIQRLMNCQGFNSLEDEDADSRHFVSSNSSVFDAYHTLCMEQIKDVININKRKSMTRINGYMDAQLE